MKIAVMGAGAVGCYYGGMLARSGHDVTLIGRRQHIDAVRRDGLLLETRQFQARVTMRAETEAGAALDGAGLVLCCVKSTDTDRAAAEMLPHLGPDTVVLSLQNGVDNAERLKAGLGREVVPTVVYVATEMAGPGHVRHHGRGELVIGSSAANLMLTTLFSDAGVPVQISENVIGELWAKLVVNCAYNALSAITQQHYSHLVQGEGVAALMQDVVQECLAVARCEGITIPGDMGEAVRRIALTMPGQLSSTAQDLARNKRSEIDHLNGHVVRLGEKLGIATPVNRVLHSLVKLLENRPDQDHR